MAWNEPGNKKDPWKSGGGDQPPDLDEIFRKLNQKLGGLFGGRGQRQASSGGSGSSGGNSNVTLLIGGVALLLALWIGASTIHFIPEAERGVVLRFGKFDRTLAQGLQFTWPRPIEQVRRVDVARVRTKSDAGQMLTRDENIVDMDFSVQYRVNNPRDFLFNLSDPEETVKQVAESAVRQVAGRNVMDFILLEGRERVASESKQIMQEILDAPYRSGIEVLAVNLQDVRPPNQVKNAFDDAIKARENAATSINQAETYANGEVPKARGRAARILEEATGYKTAVEARAKGEAERFTLLQQQYAQAPAVTRQRLYLETMQSVLRQTPKVLIDVEQGNNLMYLPLDKLTRAGAAVAPLRDLENRPLDVAPPSETTITEPRPLREGRTP
jgi:modulator of FtsH protease HflK